MASHLYFQDQIHSHTHTKSVNTYLTSIIKALNKMQEGVQRYTVIYYFLGPNMLLTCLHFPAPLSLVGCTFWVPSWVLGRLEKKQAFHFPPCSLACCLCTREAKQNLKKDLWEVLLVILRWEVTCCRKQSRETILKELEGKEVSFVGTVGEWKEESQKENSEDLTSTRDGSEIWVQLLEHSLEGPGSMPSYLWSTPGGS